jgi:hypothetical protein
LEVQAMEFFSFWFFLAVGAAGVFTVASVGAWAGARATERESLYRHELIKKIAEQPADAAERVMRFIREEEEKKDARKRAEARFGLQLGGTITFTVGIVLTIFLWYVVEPGKPVWIVGFFPLAIGVVLLAFSVFSPGPSARSDAAARTTLP